VTPDYQTVDAKIAAIETEMKRIGMWQAEPLEPEQYDFRAAFGADTMAFEQWLEFIFIPHVREIIVTRGPFPSESHVAAQAVREFDTSGFDTARLQQLLQEFDDLLQA
jgi:uncharacterized protein YqcC (DUF446 family)